MLTVLALLLAATAPGHADSLTTPGVSRQLAEYRAERIANVRYDLSLDVTRHDTAYGHVLIRFTRRLGGDAILDFRGFSIGRTRRERACALH